MGLDLGELLKNFGKTTQDTAQALSDQEKNRIARARQAKLDEIQTEKDKADIDQKNNEAAAGKTGAALAQQIGAGKQIPLFPTDYHGASDKTLLDLSGKVGNVQLPEGGMTPLSMAPADSAMRTLGTPKESIPLMNPTRSEAYSPAEQRNLFNLSGIPTNTKAFTDLNTAISGQEQKALTEKDVNAGIDAANQRHADAIQSREDQNQLNREAKADAKVKKQDEYQDKLEQQARQNLIGIRGDKALANTESQRDAAISAYNRIDQVQKAGKELNPIDYVDVLGQIYKARTGSAPTEIVLHEAIQNTAKGKLGKVYTYFTGNQAPATTEDIMKSLKSMAFDMGKQADRLHDGYMKTHLDMPTGLEPDRADRLRKLGRGITFAEATGTEDGQAEAGQPTKISSDADYDKLPSGATFIDPTGKTRRKP